MSEILEAFMKDIVKRDMIPMNIRNKIVKKCKNPSIPYIKKCLDEILAKMGNDKISSVSLFGSYATGTATSSSDVDLFVDVETGFTLFELAELQMSLEKSLGKKVDLVTTGDEYFISHINKEKIQLYERRA